MIRTIALSLTICFLFGAASVYSGDQAAGAQKATIEKKVEMEKRAPAAPAQGTAKTYPVRDPKNKIVTIETNFGKMTLELYHDVAPAHADSFAARVADGFYKNTKFHRIIDGFMIQGGDPKGDGTGSASYKLKAEFSQLPHQEGTLSMARPGDVNGASCQFFICLAQAKMLDGQYTIFGQLLKGYEVLHKIGKTPVEASNTGEKSKPVSPVIFQNAYVSDADGNPKK